MSTDRFGVPDNMFGPHEDDFYGAMGRVVLLASLLEHHVRTLATKLVVRDADGSAELSISRIITRSKDGLSRIENSNDRHAVADFLAKAKALSEKRNFYIHSIWPAQQDGSLFGWKPEPWESNARIDVDQMLSDVSEFVELNQKWHRIWPIVSGRPDPFPKGVS